MFAEESKHKSGSKDQKPTFATALGLHWSVNQVIFY